MNGPKKLGEPFKRFALLLDVLRPWTMKQKHQQPPVETVETVP
jgi:hypothetical protein